MTSQFMVTDGLDPIYRLLTLPSKYIYTATAYMYTRITVPGDMQQKTRT